MLLLVAGLLQWEHDRDDSKRFHGEVEKQDDHFQWKIQDFKASVRSEDAVFSPYFEFVGRIWGLQICSLGSHIHLILKNYGERDGSDCVTLGVKVEEAFMMRNAEPDASGRVFKVSKVMSYAELFRLSNAQILPDGTLTIYCKIARKENLEEEEKIQRESESIEEFHQDMGDLLYNSHFTDVTFLVQNKYIYAHRNILSARSPVLADTVSRGSDVDDPIRISDVEPHTFSDFLYYLYTGGFKKMNSHIAARLLPLAEKYQLPELKDECELFMKRKSVDQEPTFVDIPTPRDDESKSATPRPSNAPYRKRLRKT